MRAVAVLIRVHVSATGLPASLSPVLSHTQASGNAVDAVLLGGPTCLVGKRLWLGHHISRVPPLQGRR